MGIKIKYAKVPDVMAEAFSKCEGYVESYFKKMIFEPTKGHISISDDRFVLIRSSSLSVEFYKIIHDTFFDKGEDFADNMARSILFDLAHAIGKSDAICFKNKLGFLFLNRRL